MLHQEDCRLSEFTYRFPWAGRFQLFPWEGSLFSIFWLLRGRVDGAAFCGKLLGVAWGGNLTVEVGDLGGGLASQRHGLGILFRSLCRRVKTFLARSREENKPPPPSLSCSRVTTWKTSFLYTTSLQCLSYLFHPPANFTSLFQGWAVQLNEPH